MNDRLFLHLLFWLLPLEYDREIQERVTLMQRQCKQMITKKKKKKKWGGGWGGGGGGGERRGDLKIGLLVDTLPCPWHGQEGQH